LPVGECWEPFGYAVQKSSLTERRIQLLHEVGKVFEVVPVDEEGDV